MPSNLCKSLNKHTTKTVKSRNIIFLTKFDYLLLFRVIFFYRCDAPKGD